MTTATLDITSNTIRYGTQIFQVRNITQINVQAWRHLPKISWKVLLLSLCLGGALCLYDPMLFEKISYQLFGNGIGLERRYYYFAGMLLLLIFAYGTWERTRLKFYTLSIETSGHVASLFSSRDKTAILDAAQKIHTVMEERNVQHSYHVSVGDIIQNTGAGATIINKSII